MLEFNPNKRISAAEALKDDYFDDVRIPEQENFDPPQVDLSIDDHGKEDLSIEQLKVLVYEALKEITSDSFNFADDVEENEDY